MFQIDYLRCVNFGPFADAEVHLGEPGLTIVEGECEGQHGCDSNGSGKSTIFDAVAWALFGRCIKDNFSGDDVIKLGSKGGTLVELQITSPDGVINIRRYRKHAKYRNKAFVTIGDAEASPGTSTETTRRIEQLLGMDHLTFASSVAFGVREDVRSFFTARDSDRKEILETLLGLGVFAEAAKVAKRKAKALGADVLKYDNKVAGVEASLSAERRRIADLNKRMQEDRDIDSELAVARMAAAVCKKGIRKARALQEALREDIELEEANKQEVLAVSRRLNKYVRDQLSEASDERHFHRQLATTAHGQALSAEAEIKRMRELAGEVCPTCDQQLPKEEAQRVMQKLEIEQRRYLCLKRHEEAEVAYYDDLVKELESRPDSPPEFRHLGYLRAAERLVEEELSHWHTEFRQYASKIKDLETWREAQREDVEAVQQEIVRLEAQKKELQEALADLRRKVERLEFWVEGFGNKGLKSLLIESEIPEINSRATAYARRLLGEGTEVRLTATRELKTGGSREEMAVDASIPNCTDSYGGASRGQRKRLDLCLLLAFRDLVASRNEKPVNQLFIDELFDGMDRTGIETVGDLLRGISEQVPVVLVTHTRALKTLADRVVIVRHNGQSAQIVEK